MIGEIWASFRRLPAWVQIWVAVILAPVNLVTLAFLDQPNGVWIAALAILGMAFNLPIMLTERGLSKMMSLPHLVFWTPLVLVIVATLLGGAVSGGFWTFLVILLVIDVISLAFDYRDAWAWWTGDRAVA